MSKLDELIKKLCPDGVLFKRIDDVCTISRGIVMSKDFLRDNAGKYPVYSSQTENDGCFGYINTFKYDGEYLTWTTDGANAGTVFYRKGKFSVTNVCGLLKVKDSDVNTKFLYYALSIEAPKYVNRGMGNAKLMSNVMASIQIPVPPLEIQNEIVQILDKYTSLETELEKNLEAELEARRKQYEYYRDSLLTRETKVEVKKLGDFATITRGGNFQKKDFVESGLPCIHYGQMYTHFGTWTDKTLTYVDKTVFDKSKQAQPNDIVMAVTSENVDDVCKCTAWVGKEPIAVSGHTAIIHHNQNAKYLSYYFQSSGFYKQKVKLAHGTKVIEVTPDKLNDITIPIPPLDVQQRIVDVLDNFDSICTDLKIGLPAEIEARKKQYEYYRDLLLTFASSGNTILTEQNRTEQNRTDEIKLLQYVFGYAIVRLGEIATDIYRGSGITRDQVTTDGISCVRYGEIYTTYGIWFDKCVSHTHVEDIPSRKYFEHGDILFAITGESVEDIAKSTAYVGDEKCLVGGDIVVMKHNQNPKFLSYVLSTTDAQKQKGKGKVKSKVVHSSVPAISEITIPLPTLEEQDRIANILDRFNELCNDISSGIPAEIEARQKQYEYYRDKLLTFEKKTGIK